MRKSNEKDRMQSIFLRELNRRKFKKEDNRINADSGRGECDNEESNESKKEEGMKDEVVIEERVEEEGEMKEESLNHEEGKAEDKEEVNENGKQELYDKIKEHIENNALTLEERKQAKLIIDETSQI